MRLQPGDKVWYGPKAVTDVYSDGAVDIDSWDDNEIHTFDESVIPDVPNLPAIARFLAALPEWKNVADAITRLVAISQHCSGMLYLHGQIDPTGDFYKQLVTALDDPTLPIDWEALGGLVKAMRGEGGHE